MYLLPEKAMKRQRKENRLEKVSKPWIGISWPGTSEMFSWLQYIDPEESGS